VNIDNIRKYFIEKQGTTEELPFGPDALVFKVLGKIYAIISWKQTPLKISLKCDPQEALALRTLYSAVKPGYHLNKEHWNTVTMDDSIPGEEIFKMIDASYYLVAVGLKKSEKERLGI